jgi:hypothetical protein
MRLQRAHIALNSDTESQLGLSLRAIQALSKPPPLAFANPVSVAAYRGKRERESGNGRIIFCE